MMPRWIRIMLLALLAPAPVGCGGEPGEAVSEVADVAVREVPTSEAFQEAAAEVLPAVVLVRTEATRPASLPPGVRQPPAGPLPRGSGSGVIFSPEGYILTNDHVVREADRVSVLLADHRELDARVVARDPSTDIAVLRVQAESLPAAELGSSQELGVGEWVLALGSPLGLQFTVTAGIVSAKGRALGILSPEGPEQAAPLEYFIQTDAAINPGNSGGPLINLDGEVVGINSAIVSPTGVFAGMGFSIPIDLARNVAEQLIEFGEVRRPFLGVVLDEVTPVDAEVYGLGTAEGAELVHVSPGGPAERAGLRMGDVIVGFEGEEVETVADLQARLAGFTPRDTARLRVIREGRERTVPVALGLVRSGVRPAPPAPLAGEPALRPGFAVVETAEGVAIAAVRTYSAAARAGIRPGQVVRSVNDRGVRTAAELAAALEASRGAPVSLVVVDPALGERIINYRPG